MLARVMWVIGLSAATLGGIQACGSDGGGAAKHEQPDASSGGGSGAGGKAAGGKSGASGASGAGGVAAGGCDTSPCDQQLAPLQMIVGTILPLKSCCVNATTCGLDTTGIGALLGGGAMLPACIDPSMLTMPPAMDAGPPPRPITILDGGIIPVPDGPPIQLDKNCPDISAQALFSLPGCCRPTGTCGGSTHTLLGAGTTIALACASYDDVAASAASAFGNLVTIPDDPNIRCDYTAGPVPGGISDAGPDSTATTEPDAAPPIHDAAPPIHDAVPPNKHDAKPSTDAAHHLDAAH